MKFAVMTAFSATFAYLARHAVDLLKALWLPTALTVALQLYAIGPLMMALAGLLALGDNPDPAAALAASAGVGKWALILTVGYALLYPMMTAASLVHLVRGDQVKAPVYLRFGGDEARVLAAYSLLSGMLILISLIGELAAAVIGSVLGLLAPAVGGVARWLADLVVNVATIWFQLRLSVLYPASISTRTIGLGVAFAATKCNVWRLFGFWLLVGLVAAPAALLLMSPVIANFYPLAAKVSAAGADPAAVRAALIPLLNEIGRLFTPSHPMYWLFAALLFVTTLLTTAVANAASGTAWRYLTDRAPAVNEASVG